MIKLAARLVAPRRWPQWAITADGKAGSGAHGRNIARMARSFIERGFGINETVQLTHWMCDVLASLENGTSDQVIAEVRARVLESASATPSTPEKGTERLKRGRRA